MSNDPRFGMIRSGDTIQMTIYETYEQIKEQLDFTRDPELDGVPIRVTHAAEKYNVAHSVIHGWAERGLVNIVDTGPKLLHLDEADVKLAAQIYLKAREYMPSRKASWVLKRALRSKLQPSGE